MDFYSASSLKQQKINFAPTRTHYPDSEPTSVCAYSLMQYAERRNIKNNLSYTCFIWAGKVVRV